MTTASLAKQCEAIQSALLSAALLPLSAEDAVQHAITELYPELYKEYEAGQLTPNVSETDVPRSLIMMATRSYLIELVQRAAKEGQPVMKYVLPGGSGEPIVKRYLDMVLVMCERHLVEVGLYSTMIEDLVDTSIISDCQDVFTFLEDNILRQGERFKRPLTYSYAKQMVLRTCNQLVRRLSKANDALLCGRVLLFMAKLYALSERSGVNVQGFYNSSRAIQPEEVRAGERDSAGDPIDGHLYHTFWKLQGKLQQDVLPKASAPGRAVDFNQWWGDVHADITTVLDAFSKQSVTVDIDLTALDDPSGASPPAVQYMVSKKLFGLQLRDATFRRHFLVQCLILLQSLRKPPRSESPLKGKLLTDADEVQTRVIQILEETGAEGKAFAGAVQDILGYEEWWVDWKFPPAGAAPAGGPARPSATPGCHPFERPPVNKDIMRVKRGPTRLEVVTPGDGPTSKRRRTSTSHVSRGRRVLESPIMNSMWSPDGDLLEELKVSARPSFPSLPTLLEKHDVWLSMDPKEDVADEYKKIRDKVFAWKVQRLMVRTNVEVFSAYKDDLEEAAARMFPDKVPEAYKEILQARDVKRAASRGRAKDSAGAARAPADGAGRHSSVTSPTQ